MKRIALRMLALALALALTAGLSVTAFADPGFAPGQSYVRDDSQEKVFAVAVKSGADESPEALRDRLLEAGYDAYVYDNNGAVGVLCGKYRDVADARAAKDAMSEALEDLSVVTARAWLPAEAVDAFEAGPQEASAFEEKAAEAGTAETAADDAPKSPAADAPAATPKPRKASSWQDTEGSSVYAVSLSASKDLAYAEGIVARMQEKGFDAYILENGSGYQVLSGKFHDICDALRYRDCIWSNTDRTDTYIATVTVPEDEIAAFTEIYERDGLPGKIKADLEKPTGAFYRETKGDTLAFTVQFSAGTSFSGAERNRDNMSAAGYPAFVYECSRIYEVMTGAFYNREDAEALCEQLHANTAESDAYVTRAWLPSGMVK